MREDKAKTTDSSRVRDRKARRHPLEDSGKLREVNLIKRPNIVVKSEGKKLVLGLDQSSKRKFFVG